LVYVSRNNKDSGAYDLGELDQALFLYLNGQNDPTSVHEQKRKLFFNHMKIM
jgi:transcription factor TGA